MFAAEKIVVPCSLAIAQQRGEDMTKLRLLFDAGAIDPDWFSPEFLKQVSSAHVEQIISRIKGALGPLKGVQVNDGSGFLQFENARVPVRIGFDKGERIEMLWVGSPQLENLSLEDLVQKLKGVAAGVISVFVTVDGKPVLDEKSEKPLAVGSAFKLIILKAYEDAVKAGDIKRDQVVMLEDHDRSLPSGTLQVLSPGTPVTLEVLAQLMIKISDNTATDALLRILGRDKLETISPRNVPFMTTRELFQLIAPGAGDIRAQYKAGELQERRKILSSLNSERLPEVNRIARFATWQDVEWYLTAREICELLGELERTPALDDSSQPLFEGMDWQHIGYKGGSEYGVLNLSAIGTTRQGHKVCVVVTANGNAPQAEDQIAPLFADLLRVAGTSPG
ncbi:serine hydrolase [Rhizobium sp. P28RR-XV]|uniref:serine hydrolase n=1 Tax=Rhizobium sp. P28RR-XV TaxID=2726737 RepID=UPI0014568C55|nr:serine hydrolase [Rhizobium sp. P28RR-XV]NLR88383.1 serine hydrolase [Rhizobium sp. P28RR-XV]